MKCIKCGLPIGEIPEDATREELLYNKCYDISENLYAIKEELQEIITEFRNKNDFYPDIEITEKLLEYIYEDIKETSDSFKDDRYEYFIDDITASFKRSIAEAINKYFV